MSHHYRFWGPLGAFTVERRIDEPIESVETRARVIIDEQLEQMCRDGEEWDRLAPPDVKAERDAYVARCREVSDRWIASTMIDGWPNLYGSFDLRAALDAIPAPQLPSLETLRKGGS